MLIGAADGDAVTSMAIALRNSMRRSFDSEIYAQHFGNEIAHEVLPLAQFSRAQRGDIIVYHSSIGEPEVTRWLLSRAEPIVLVYHNITPPEYFMDLMPSFAANLLWGRHELELIRSRVVLAVADSRFNAQDLTGLGFPDVHVVPAGLRPGRLTSARPVGSIARAIRDSFPHGFVLSVSQVLPHKRFDTLIETMHLTQWVHERPLGLAIIGNPRHAGYFEALQRHAARLRVDRVWFFGRATDCELATFYRLASMYVTTSAHEGLALPPLEAMSFGVPVIARAAGALADTIGGAGVVLPSDAGPMLISESVAEVASNDQLRRALTARGASRVAEIEREDPAGVFLRLLAGVV